MNLRIILLSMAIACAALSVSAQTDSAITYSEVIKVDSVPKDILFQRARLWFASTFKDPKEVIQVADKDAGELIGKGSTTGISSYRIMGSDSKRKSWYTYMFRVVVKDGRYRYEVTQIKHEGDENEYGHIVPDNAIGYLTTASVNHRKYPFASQRKVNEWYLSVKNAGIGAIESIISDFKAKMAVNSLGAEF